jgi:uncharacterized lipoprotein YajG
MRATLYRTAVLLALLVIAACQVHQSMHLLFPPIVPCSTDTECESLNPSLWRI